LVLLGDAMLRAHSEAINTTGAMVRAVNTQDVFHGALVPAVLFVALAIVLAWIGDRRRRRATATEIASEPLTLGGWLTAGATLLVVAGLLTAVALGRLYAVEGAATGGVLLVLCGLAAGRLGAAPLRAILEDTMALTGALFALFVAATCFTLVFRGFGTDRV